jgi:lipopolysaccharide/colanic/teichoic acid biosynthesis glycosyltransferase
MQTQALPARTTDADVSVEETPLELVPAADVEVAVSSGGVAAGLPDSRLRLEGWDLERIRHGADAAVKRAVDIAVSATLLLLLLPAIVAAAVLIKLDSPGPVFFRSRRAGFNGRPLCMLKFRKMRDGAHGLALTTDDDTRFTRVGGWLARTKIDEVPQLWHVLRGEMSLVGPRPEDPVFVARHAGDYDDILTVRPGITGYSQLAFAEESRILDDDDPLGHYVHRLLPQKLHMDRMYASTRTLAVDLNILLWTVAAVLLRRQVAVHRASGRMNLRKR